MLLDKMMGWLICATLQGKMVQLYGVRLLHKIKNKRRVLTWLQKEKGAGKFINFF